MNAKDIFNKAVIKTNILPDLINTPAMRRQIMMATVAEWLWGLDSIMDRPEARESVMATMSEALHLINNHLNRHE